MRRYLWIIAALAVTFAAFACDGDDGNGTSATTSAPPTTAATSPTAVAATPTSSAGDGRPAIIIDEPGLGDIVQIPFEIAGTADVFEAALTVQVLAPDGALVCQHSIMATSGSGTRGDWATTMAFAPPVPPSGNAAVPMVVRALSYSAKDGSEENVVTVDVNVSGER
ncbi:MAG TPA: Gmad2 immunoglobulin-like domain-containing protein, partial [Dehalococcoidia bacterium]|nr:Gmad2 immunoglobulin-like domain-containing protein [Dehalococcoidia bacterium]